MSVTVTRGLQWASCYSSWLPTQGNTGYKRIFLISAVYFLSLKPVPTVDHPIWHPFCGSTIWQPKQQRDTLLWPQIVICQQRQKEARRVLHCCLLTWSSPRLISSFKKSTLLTCSPRQTGSQQPLSWCINCAAPISPPAWTKGGGDTGLLPRALGAILSSFSHCNGRRCSRLGVRWYLMWRGPVFFPDILSRVHCCTAPILHRSQSRSHQMALKLKAESGSQRGERGRQKKTERRGGKQRKCGTEGGWKSEKKTSTDCEKERQRESARGKKSN